MEAETITHRLEAALLVGILGLGIGLRLVYLDRDMRFDESLNFLGFASKSIPTIVADYSAPNNHIFHTLLVHLAYAGLGNHPMILRLAAWIPGVLIIPLTHRVARRLFTREAALLASGFVAVSPPLIDLSVNARGYSLQTCLTLALLLLSWKVLKHNRTSDWLLFALVGALGFWTIPTMAYPMGAVALWLLMSILLDRRTYFRRLLAKNFVTAMGLSAALTAILYAPVIVFSGWSKLVANDSLAQLPAGEFYGRFGDVVRLIGDYLAWGLPPALALLMMAGAGVGIVLHRRLSKASVSLLLATLAWMLPVLLLHRVIPYHRTLTPLIPLYLIGAAAGLAHGLRLAARLPTARAVILSGLIVLGAVSAVTSGVIATSSDTGWAPDAEAAAFYFAGATDANDSVFSSYPSNWTLAYYKELRGLTASQPPSDAPRQYIYYHTAEERARLLDALRDEIDEDYATASFRVVHAFEHSTVEEILMDAQAVADGDEG